MNLVQQKIESFNTDDYSALTQFYNEVDPDYPTSEEEVRSWDKRRDPKIAQAYFVVKDGAKIIAVAEYYQYISMYHPQKLGFGIDVLPNYRKQGIGSSLYKHLLEASKKFDPILFRLRTRENRPDALRFITKRGFAEESREWESRIDPNTIDFQAFNDLFKKLNEQNIEIVQLSELMKRDTDYRRKLYDMEEKAEEGMPVPEGEVLTRPDFKAWEKMYFENPNLMPEAHLIAVHKDKYVGTNTLWPSEAEAGCVYNGLTGIDKNYRRKGIATALKVKNLEWAKNKKYTKVKTWNDTTNRAMLSINEALGFQKEPAWIGFKKSVNGD